MHPFYVLRQKKWELSYDEKKCTKQRGAAAAGICEKAKSSQRSAVALLTFVWPLREQVLVLLFSTSDDHTGQSSFHSRRLLCRLSWEVQDPQLVVPGLRGTQLARTTVYFKKYMKAIITLSVQLPEREGHEDTRTTVFYIGDAWRLPVQLPEQLPAILLLFQMNLRKNICNPN